MNKNAIAAVVGSVCAMIFWEPHSFGQALSGTSLNVSGTATIGTLVSGTATINLLTSGTAAFNELAVSGAPDFQNNTLLIGTSGTNPALSIVYNDAGNSSVTLQSTRASSVWNWQRLMASGSSARAMQLDVSNRLILTGTAATNPPQLVLDPNGTISINGSNFLTQPDADSRYIPISVGLTGFNGKIGIGTSTPTARLEISNSSASTVGEIIRGAVGQTADLFQIQDSGSNNLLRFYQGTYAISATTSCLTNSLKIGSPTGADASADIFVTTDENFPTVNALYIAPNYATRRVFIGKKGADVFALNLSHVGMIEGFPQCVTAAFDTVPNNDWSQTGRNASVISSRYAGHGGDLMLVSNILCGSQSKGTNGTTRGVNWMSFEDGSAQYNVNGAGFTYSMYYAGPYKNYNNVTISPMLHTAWAVGNSTNSFYAGGGRAGDIMTLDTNGTFTNIIKNASNIGHIIKGSASQTADLQEWQNSAGTVLSVINSSGNIGIGTATPQSTLDVNGSAKIAGNLAISGTGSLTLADGTVLSGSNTFKNVMTSGTALTISGSISASHVTGLSAVAITGNYSSLAGAPTDNIQLANGAGYITASGTAAFAQASGTASVLSGTIQASQVEGLAPVATSGTLDYSNLTNAPASIYLHKSEYLPAKVFARKFTLVHSKGVASSL